MADVSSKLERRGRLASSSFALLGVSLRSNKSQIIDAYGDRLFEGIAEDELAAARSRLTLSRDRLAEELRFLPELAPARAREVLAELEASSDPSDSFGIAEELPNLSKINVYSDLLETHGPVALKGALRAHRDFDPTAAREAIDQTRAASGFASISDEAWAKEIKSFQQEQAHLLFKALLKTEDPSETLVEIMQGSSSSLDWDSGLIDLTVDQYDRWSEPQLVRVEEELDRSIESVRALPTDAAALKKVDAMLAAWDSVSQPVQLRDEAKGLDEPKSKRVFGKVRELAVWLANDCQQFSAAYELARALERTFPELPSVVSQLSEDLETLGSLADRVRSQELIQPLIAVAERAKANISRFASDVLRGHFAPDGRGLAGELYAHHVAASALSDRLSPPDLPWYITRSVALELNNGAEEPHAAALVIEAIQEGAPSTVSGRLQGELNTLRGLSLQKDFHKAVEAQEFEKARDIANTIMAEVPEERERFRHLRDVLDERLSRRKRSRWFWGIIAALVALGFLVDLTNRPDSSGYDYSPDTYRDESLGTSTEWEPEAAVEPEVAPTQEVSAIETPPALGHYGPLSLSELRYCKFEDRRIDMLDVRVPPSAYYEFNQRVSDFNSRCANGSYRASDGRTIDAELNSLNSSIIQQVDEILQSWTPVSPSVPNPSYDFEADSLGVENIDVTSDAEENAIDDPLAPLDNLYGPGD